MNSPEFRVEILGVSPGRAGSKKGDSTSSEGSGDPVGNDLGIPVGLGPESLAGSDPVLVDDPLGSEAHAPGILEPAEGESPAGVQPPVSEAPPWLRSQSCDLSPPQLVFSAGFCRTASRAMEISTSSPRIMPPWSRALFQLIP